MWNPIANSVRNILGYKEALSYDRMVYSWMDSEKKTKISRIRTIYVLGAH